MDSGTKAGTIGGTLLTILMNITKEDILKTSVLASIGAIVSFGISLLLKYCIKLLKK
jgi:mannitol-specific phosphotransferase system IIBC component